MQKATDMITKPSARVVYERGFETSDTLLGQWNNAFEKAKLNTLETELPFTIVSQSQKDKAFGLGYKIELKRGEILKVVVDKNRDSSRVFIDLFKFETDSILSNNALVSNDLDSDSLSYQTTITGFYKVVIQPEINDSLIYHTKVYTQPSFQFPVSGKGNAAIGGLWGAFRDGGKRAHQGIDIFASRGTPILAVADGYISYAGEKGLGGKQVWLRDGFFGQSLYYAHLDSILIAKGSKVKVGDTLGLVGNTGNAKTTPPHLHFGIYTRSGAIDPLPFVKVQNIPIHKDKETVLKVTTKLKYNELRSGASTKYLKLATLPRSRDAYVLGKSEQWYHVSIGDSLEGFMHQSLLKEL